jgi:hypothetical protein
MDLMMVAPVGAMSGYLIGLVIAVMVDSFASFSLWDKFLFYTKWLAGGAAVGAIGMTMFGILVMTPVYAIEWIWDRWVRRIGRERDTAIDDIVDVLDQPET